MPVAPKYQDLARSLARAWLSHPDGGRLPAVVFPAYADTLHELLMRFVLWGEREDKIPTAEEFAQILDDLRFLLRQADPNERSPIHRAAIRQLHDAEALAQQVLR